MGGRGEGGFVAEAVAPGLRRRRPTPARWGGGGERPVLDIPERSLAAAVADGAWIFAEYGVEDGDVVRHQRLFITLEFGGHLGDDLRQVDLHHPLLTLRDAWPRRRLALRAHVRCAALRPRATAPR